MVVSAASAHEGASPADIVASLDPDAAVDFGGGVYVVPHRRREAGADAAYREAAELLRSAGDASGVANALTGRARLLRRALSGYARTHRLLTHQGTR